MSENQRHPNVIAETEAEVFLDPESAGVLFGVRGASVYLEPQIHSGERTPRRSKQLLMRKGALPGGMFWVPGFGARLDAHGNVSRRQVAQSLSAVGGYGQVGFLANKSLRCKAWQNRETDDIFVINKSGGHLAMGIYTRTCSGGLKPLMLFVKTPHYHVHLPFQEIINTVYNANFQFLLNKHLRCGDRVAIDEVSLKELAC